MIISLVLVQFVAATILLIKKLDRPVICIDLKQIYWLKINKTLVKKCCFKTDSVLYVC